MGADSTAAPDWVPPAAEVVSAYRRHVNVGQARLATLLGLPLEVRSEGSHVFDERGDRYLDCGGYGVFTLGHRHPVVTAAVSRQLDLQPLSTRLFLSPQLARAATALVEVTPEPLQKVTFTNSGAESVELALKLARSTGRSRVIAMERGFHGKTLAALAVTGRRRYRQPFEPLLPDVEHVPFGDVDALASALARPPRPAVLVEPVQAEGGVRIPPDGYLAEVTRLCRAHDALLVVDEIQTGLGRLGTFWGCDQTGAEPDILLTGKALGGGVMPVAAVVSTPEVYARLDAEPVLHSSTFAGSPMAAAAVLASLRVMRADDVPAVAERLGRTLLERVTAAVAEAGDVVADVRGRGLLIGIEFRVDHHGARFLECMLDEHVIVCYSLNSDRTVRLTPPYTLTSDDCDWLVAATSNSVARLTKRA